MTEVDVIWPARNEMFRARGYFDCALLEQILDRTLWTPRRAIEFVHHEVRSDADWPDVPGALVIFNGRANVADADWLIDQIDALEWSVVIITGDEEWGFPWERIPETDTRKVWVMAPHPEHEHLSYRIPGGWYPDTREELAPHADAQRKFDWFFAGQVTHTRRRDCVASVTRQRRGKLIETDGFLRGVPSDEYMGLLAQSKVVLCPSGPVTVDTSRPLSAMEAGCVPIVDMRRPIEPQFDYWSLVFGEEWPMPWVGEWNEAPRVIDESVRNFGDLSAQVYSWWQQWKRRTALKLDADLRSVMPDKGLLTVDDRITAIVTSSPIPSHPSTEILEQTVDSIRAQLPLAEIVIVMDGVRPEQQHLRSQYQEYVRRVLWKCNFEWHNVLPVVMPEWGHQANATRRALEFVETDVILFVEHDTPILGDIPWDDLIGMVEDGHANAIRLHQDIEIHEDHQRVMIDHITQYINRVPARRTKAWWQRPHLASADFYRQLLDEFFPPESRTMIEDRIYGEMWVDCEVKREGWGRWKVWVYHPDGEDIRRSGHLDGRAEQPKYDMDFG